MTHRGPLDVRRAQAASATATASSSPRTPTMAPAAEDGRPPDRHHRLPRHALLRDRLRQLVRRRPRTRSASTTGSAAASTTRWPASRTAGCRPRPGPSASCRPPTRRPASTPSTASVFGQPIGDYQLTQAKLGRMAVLIQAARQFAYDVARLMARGRGPARGVDGQGLRVQGRRVGHPRGHADPRRLRLRRGVPGQPLLRRRPRAVDLRGRRRDALPQGHRPPPRRATSADPSATPDLVQIVAHGATNLHQPGAGGSSGVRPGRRWRRPRRGRGGRCRRGGSRSCGR